MFANVTHVSILAGLGTPGLVNDKFVDGFKAIVKYSGVSIICRIWAT
jgi:hypothetical protein